MAVTFFHSVTVLFLSLALFVSHFRVYSEPVQDKQALLAFLSQVRHAKRLQWNASVSACSWVGIECDPTQSFVYTLRLPGVGLVGQIPPNTLGKLSQLRVLSLRSNRLSGEIPSDFSNLTLLRSLYLQNNGFSGGFPRSVTQLTRLTRLDLSTNKFTGPIPFDVNNLTHLTGLFLENNTFSGNLPSINPANLSDFNVSNNNLNGSIPAVLFKFSKESFSGNLNLCGGPLPPCSPFFPSPAPSPTEPTPPLPSSKKSKRLSTAAIVLIAVGSALIAFLLLLFLLLCLRRRKQRQSIKTPKQPVVAKVVPVEAGTSSSKDDITGRSSVEADRNKLVFFERGVYSVDLEDLLRASAEVLGKRSVGTSYKVVLEKGTTVVVKEEEEEGDERGEKEEEEETKQKKMRWVAAT